MHIVAISDTHNKHEKIVIPECDLLIHAGDASFNGTDSELTKFAEWLHKQPAKYKIFVPGNHEEGLEKDWEKGTRLLIEGCPDLIILNDSGITLDGVKIWGSPITPWFHDWAWNRRRYEINVHWDQIPTGTNILITHGPPQCILDRLHSIDGTPKGAWAGCPYLRQKIREVKPDLHIFGHIHYHGGNREHQEGTSFYNVAICDEMYAPTNPVTEIEYYLD
jgi:Icc-related predicted phosphoesterase